MKAGCCHSTAGEHLADTCTAVLACSSANICNWYRLLLSKHCLDSVTFAGQGPLQGILLTFAEVIQELSIAQKTEYVQGSILADSDVNDCGKPWSKASWHGPAVEPIWVASG